MNMQLGKLALCTALAWLSAPAHAQIFPEIERKDVVERLPEPPAINPDKPKPEDGPRVDGAAVLARFDELLTGYATTKVEQRKLSERATDTAHESVRRYLEGQALLRLGYFDDAARAFERVGIAVPKESEIKETAGDLRKIAAEIKSGNAFYLRMIAVVMNDYRSFSDEIDLDNVWTRARRKGEAVDKDLQRAIDRKAVDEAAGIATRRRMTDWLSLGKARWREQWSAEQTARENPAQLQNWVRVLYHTGFSATLVAGEDCPQYLRRRAAATVIKQFWPQATIVTDGTCDVAIAGSHIGAFQFQEYAPHLEMREYHSQAGKGAVTDFAAKATSFVEAFNRLRN